MTPTRRGLCLLKHSRVTIQPLEPPLINKSVIILPRRLPLHLTYLMKHSAPPLIRFSNETTFNPCSVLLQGELRTAELVSLLVRSPFLVATSS